MTLQILSFTENTDFKWVREPTKQQMEQSYTADVGQLASRSEITALFSRDARIPRSYQSTVINGILLVVKQQEIAQNKEIPNLWNIHTEWISPTLLPEKTQDPTKRPVLIATGTYKSSEIPDIDYDSKPICTTAGEPINFNQQRSYPTFTLTKNLADYPQIFGQFRDFVNNDSVTIYGITYNPWELFIPDVSISPLQYEAQYAFYELQLTIYVNTKKYGWRTRLRNAGYHERVETGIATRRRRNGTTVIVTTGRGSRQRTVKTYSLRAITLGEPGKTHYPSSPVLLDPSGKAFRDPNGNVIALQNVADAPASQAITKEQWEKAVVEVTLHNEISFNQYVPLY